MCSFVKLIQLHWGVENVLNGQKEKEFTVLITLLHQFALELKFFIQFTKI